MFLIAEGPGDASMFLMAEGPGDASMFLMAEGPGDTVMHQCSLWLKGLVIQ